MDKKSLAIPATSRSSKTWLDWLLERATAELVKTMLALQAAWHRVVLKLWVLKKKARCARLLLMDLTRALRDLAWLAILPRTLQLGWMDQRITSAISVCQGTLDSFQASSQRIFSRNHMLKTLQKVSRRRLRVVQIFLRINVSYQWARRSLMTNTSAEFNRVLTTHRKETILSTWWQSIKNMVQWTRAKTIS